MEEKLWGILNLIVMWLFRIRGIIQKIKDREYYIETLYYPGTRTEWECLHGPDDWRSKRSKKIICADEL